MPGTHVLLERITIGPGNSSGVSFNNIPQTGYTDLKIVASVRSNRATFLDETLITFNGITTGYYATTAQGNGTAATSYQLVNGGSFINIMSVPGASQTVSTFGNYEIYIPNYTSSSNKAFTVDLVSENNATDGTIMMAAGLLQNTAAITSVSFTPRVASFVQDSTFSLYGIASVGTSPLYGPKATGGDVVQKNGNYWVHTFLSSGSFIPKTSTSVDYLVIAGGGGGAGDYGGGGGAGGYRESTLSLTSNTVYTVTVGAGGAANGGAAPSGAANTGSNSVFGSVTSNGGGYGGGFGLGNTNQPGGSGGSGGGGGAGESADPVGAGGGGTAGQGYAGSAGTKNSSWRVGGSGGGAGGAGGTSVGSTGASTGGIGVYSSITGTSVGRAGGGSGASQGGSGTNTASEGGGAGAKAGATTGSSATVNTGGGGGGGPSTGGAGGSGIVIVRYLA